MNEKRVDIPNCSRVKSGPCMRRTRAHCFVPLMHLQSETQIDPLETCDAHIVTYTKQNTCSYFRMEFVCAISRCCWWWCCGVCEKMRNFITNSTIRSGFFWKSWIRKRARSHAGVPSKINISWGDCFVSMRPRWRSAECSVFRFLLSTLFICCRWY